MVLYLTEYGDWYFHVYQQVLVCAVQKGQSRRILLGAKKHQNLLRTSFEDILHLAVLSFHIFDAKIMFNHHMKYVAHGFLGGVAVTASVCYSLIFKVSPHNNVAVDQHHKGN